MIRAMLFDVDGTLYYQAPLRAAMACELAVLPCVTASPDRVRTIWRVLGAFRRVREELRAMGRPEAPLEDRQYAETAARTHVNVATVRTIVSEWIFTRPLRHVRQFRRVGLRQAIEALEHAGIRVGVFSDYPTEAKIEALRLTHAVSVQLCATDRDINAFKPHPRGFLMACERWGLSPPQVAYVGDRAEIDAVGAAAAGMRCLIIGERRRLDDTSFVPLRRFSALEQALRRMAPTTAGMTTVHVGER
jgi:FMN phosphatase YigB (HAD superfamily)